MKLPQRRTRSVMAPMNSGAARRRATPAFVWYSSPEGGHGRQERSHHSEAAWYRGQIRHMSLTLRCSDSNVLATGPRGMVQRLQRAAAA